MVIFFAAHVIGLIHSDDIDFGIEDIGMKMSLLLVPIFFSIARLNVRLRQLIGLYLLGLIISWLVFYGYAAGRSIYYPENNNWGYFQESYLSFNMHRSYYATYNAIGSLFATILLFRTRNWKYLLLILLAAATTILTFSKAGVLILIILIVPLLYFLLTRYLKRLYAAFGMITISVILVSSINFNQGLKDRFQQMFDKVSNVQTEQNTSVESNTSRLIMWSTSLIIFKENLAIGVGTGDVQYAMNDKNMELGNTGVAKENYNAHNQYLNTAVQLGLMGLLPLLMIIMSSILLSIQKRSLVLLMMTLAFAATFSFESFLETQAGIVPVTLFLSIFAVKSLETNNSKNTKVSI
jgi:O-antigen ligase